MSDTSPWVEPPAWWKDSLHAWADLLQREWEAAGEQLKNDPEHQRRLQLVEHMGRAFAEYQLSIVLECLEGKH